MNITVDSLIGIVDPKPNSTVMIYDVHASESGALAILDDLYKQICEYQDKSVNWVFIVSTPKYQELRNITVERFPWVKKSWGHRYYFDTITTRKLLKKYNPDVVFSLQNKGISFFKKEQLVYLHLPFILTDHRFRIKEDGKKLWFYQNVVSKSIFRSLRKVDITIVQTQWMKNALVKKANVSEKAIKILQPYITTNQIGKYRDAEVARKTFFYPSTGFTYKNHLTLLKALNYAQNHGLSQYQLILTITPNENAYTQMLYRFVREHNINVEFGGKIPRESVFEQYTKSVLVFPSYVESFGLPLLEAKLTGAPVIASDCPFSREILNGYEKASFFDEMNWKMFGKLILDVAKGNLK